MPIWIQRQQCMLDEDGDGYGKHHVVLLLEIELMDSNNGDWEGASIDVSLRDISENYTLTTSGSSTFEFCMHEEERFEVNFNSGDWDSEVRFIIRRSRWNRTI